MAAQIIVFENADERSGCCAGMCHDWENQPNIFGKEAKKLLQACETLMKLWHHRIYYPELSFEEAEVREQILLKKIYGIAKAHGVHIIWYGNANPTKPERFLISGHGFERLALISC